MQRDTDNALPGQMPPRDYSGFASVTNPDTPTRTPLKSRNSGYAATGATPPTVLHTPIISMDNGDRKRRKIATPPTVLQTPGGNEQPNQAGVHDLHAEYASIHAQNRDYIMINLDEDQSFMVRGERIYMHNGHPYRQATNAEIVAGVGIVNFDNMYHNRSVRRLFPESKGGYGVRASRRRASRGRHNAAKTSRKTKRKRKTVARKRAFSKK